MTATQQPRTITNKVIKDRVTFLQRTDGKGSPTVLEIELAPGGGNFPHIHTTYDETFTAVRGTLGLRVGGKELRLEPGESTTAQRGTVHNFFNPSQESVTFRVELTPGHRGFEGSLIIGYGLADDGLTDAKSIPKNLVHTALLLEMSDMRFPGLMGLLMPVLRLMAAYARGRGVEQELLRKYGA
ncbi:cupin domain-containing protein [Allomeiothermus silvanus]|uniref:cupin domain-containing protein n=1 Tax=Allomeiothermus silvanus TaxID=52022 RepID=UPI0023F5688D|nr:cupin domain-containing protein [Allomeiothermus silvanus]